MKQNFLWLFYFTQPDRLCCSARVAAHSRADACSVMSEHLGGRPLVAEEFKHPEPGTILSHFGKTMDERVGLVAFVNLEGQFVEVPAQ